MTTNELRSKYLEFFKSKRHTIIPSAPIVPEHDPTTLFNSAGMQPLVPNLLGEPHPAGKRIADVQKCLRTTDIDEVGDETHLTMFEMLGNWSFGDYFKKESIAMSWEFLTDPKWLGIDPKKLYITVYEGDAEVPKDSESVEYWQEHFKSVGMDAKEGERIIALGKDDNWWEQGGVETGPAGPDTEIFYYLGDEENPKFEYADQSKYVEIWNNVFLTYQRQKEGGYKELEQKNVDTGMGVERTAAALEGVKTVYDTDLLSQIGYTITGLASEEFDQVFLETDQNMGRAIRIITDHLRAATFLAADGVQPSNTEQGYVMRRLMRRAIRQGLVLGIKSGLSETVGVKVIELYGEVYSELTDQQNLILDILTKEEEQFRKTLDRGVREFTREVKDKLTGETAFRLFDTYGFPPELSVEDAKRLNIPIDPNWDEDFQRLMNEQKERSRTATAGVFKGGLADHSEQVTKYHTANHLMYAALRHVLGNHVIQRGSNITEERLRFDFSHTEKVTPEQLKEVEEIVNHQIHRDLPVTMEELPTQDAFAAGAIGAFGDKYGDTVKVYTIGDFSKEICGGPHVEQTGVLGHFKITKEESSSAGVRRIKATLA